MNDVMELVLTHARQVLAERGQAAPVDDHTIRVTYAGGGFQLLDVAGFSGGDDEAKVRQWVETMLTPASGLVPGGLLPVIWAERGTPDEAFTMPIGVGLVVGVLRDGEPVSKVESATWGVDPDDVLKAARRTLAATPFTSQQQDHDGQLLIMVDTPEGSANAWALFPSLLKSATGRDEPQVVFLPDPGHCCVVAASQTDELVAAQDWAAVRYAQAERPVSPAAYVMDGRQLVRWTGR